LTLDFDFWNLEKERGPSRGTGRRSVVIAAQAAEQEARRVTSAHAMHIMVGGLGGARKCACVFSVSFPGTASADARPVFNFSRFQKKTSKKSGQLSRCSERTSKPWRVREACVLPLPRPADAFAQIDANGDGVISREEHLF